MTTSFAPSTPASVIAGARELAAGLHDVLWAAKTAREKLDVVVELLPRSLRGPQHVVQPRDQFAGTSNHRSRRTGCERSGHGTNLCANADKMVANLAP